jgi:multisubunit Na+/H+ antiporter MnhC subunit
MEKSNCNTLIVSLLIAAALWLVGGFFLSKEMGMVCVIIGLAIAGWAAGNVMNSSPKE